MHYSVCKHPASSLKYSGADGKVYFIFYLVINLRYEPFLFSYFTRNKSIIN